MQQMVTSICVLWSACEQKEKQKTLGHGAKVGKKNQNF